MQERCDGSEKDAVRPAAARALVKLLHRCRGRGSTKRSREQEDLPRALLQRKSKRTLHVATAAAAAAANGAGPRTMLLAPFALHRQVLSPTRLGCTGSQPSLVLKWK
jgi:hypothetical protein